VYKIIKSDGTELGVTDSVLFIKRSPEGTFIEADEAEAIGIAFKGEPYNLHGHDEIQNAKTVVLVKTTLAQILLEQNAAASKLQANMDYLAMMAEVDLDEPGEDETDKEVTE